MLIVRTGEIPTAADVEAPLVQLAEPVLDAVMFAFAAMAVPGGATLLGLCIGASQLGVAPIAAALCKNEHWTASTGRAAGKDE